MKRFVGLPWLIPSYLAFESQGASPNDNFAMAAELPANYVQGPESGLDWPSAPKWMINFDSTTAEPGEPSQCITTDSL